MKTSEIHYDYILMDSGFFKFMVTYDLDIKDLAERQDDIQIRRSEFVGYYGDPYSQDFASSYLDLEQVKQAIRSDLMEFADPCKYITDQDWFKICKTFKVEFCFPSDKVTSIERGTKNGY